MTAQLALTLAQSAPAVTLSDIQNALPAEYHTCYIIEKPVTCANPATDIYRDWNIAVAAGKSYMVSSMSMAEYLKRYTSPINAEWMKLAYLWARQNPTQSLHVDSSHKDRRGFSVGGFTWRIGERGDYVEFTLPHQDSGGEKCWISRDGKTRLLVNED